MEEQFQDIVYEINEKTRAIELSKELIELNTSNSERKDILKELFADLYSSLDTISENIKEFNSTKNSQFIKDTIDVYNDEIDHIVSKIRENKYHTKYVEFNKESNKFHLVQKENSIQDLEVGNEGEIESFVL